MWKSCNYCSEGQERAILKRSKQTNCNQRKWNWWVNCTKYWCGYICLLQMSIICYRWLVWSLPVWFGWKPIPSVARVTRDEVSGFIKHEGTAVWKTVPPLLCSFAFGSVRTRSKGSGITPMRRILSFHGFLFLLVLPLDIGFTTDCFCAYTALDYLQQEIIRENPSARQAQTNHNWIKKSVKEQIRRISVIRDWFWTWRARQRRVSTSMGYCLPDSSPLFS